MRWPEHTCPMPKCELSDYGRLYLCTCGRLYVGRDEYVDAVCPKRVGAWERITTKRWWRW